LCLARHVLDREIEGLAVRALSGGADRGSVAFALGVSRSSLYRVLGDRFAQKGPP
jgi:hypothetical protein